MARVISGFNKEVHAVPEYLTAEMLQEIENIIIILDAEGIITHINPFFEKISGYSISHLQGKSWKDLIDKKEHDSVPEKSINGKTGKTGKTGKEGDRPSSGRYQLRTKSGQIRHIIQNVSPLKHGHPSQGTIILGQDITLMVQHEEECRKNERFSTFNSFCSRLSHEIRNPLSGILLNAQMLAEEIKEGSSLSIYIQDILSGTKKIEQYINRLMTFAESSQAQKRSFSLTEITQEALQMITDQAINSSIRIQTEFDSKMPSVFGDPSQIRQVLFNLFINAIEAMPQGGILSIEGRHISPPETTKPQDIKIELKVKDNGCGIPPEIQSKIFDPFFTTKKKHSGIGLSIVYSLLEKNNGNIRAESPPSKGTSFVIQLSSRVGL